MAELMNGYLRAMENALLVEPTRLARARCRVCALLFLTSKPNEGRTDMRCPTGCWDHHNKEDSNRRSGEYYKTKEGREKKKALNKKRSLNKPQKPDSEVKKATVPAIIRYYGWLIRALDGVELDPAEIEMLRERARTNLRQRSRDIRDEVRENRDD